MNKRTAILGVSWGLSMLAAVWIAAQWRANMPETATSGAVAPVTPETPAPVPDGETHSPDALQAEIESLRAQVAALEQARLDQGKKYLLLSLEKWTDAGGRVPLTEADARNVWDHYMELIGRHPGLDSIEDSIRLYGMFLAAGEPGIQFLGKVLTDVQRSENERDAAEEILTLLCTPASYAALLRYQPALFPEEDYPYDALVPHLERLPTDQVRGGFSVLLNQVRRDLASEGGQSPCEVLGLLAFTHRDGEARLLLRDRRLLGEDAASMIPLAQASGSSEARDFVESLARGHTSEEVRQQAQNVLDAW